MPLTIGVDESIIDRTRDQSFSRYIYVASSTMSNSGNVTNRDKEFNKRMEDEASPLELYGRFRGFLFRTFILDPASKGSFREKYFRTVTSMIGETIYLTKELGVFTDKKIIV